MNVLEGVLSSFRHRGLEKKMHMAEGWPVTKGEIYHWAIVAAEKGESSFAHDSQIEAGFHFKVGDEYYGGYLRSVAMARREAERAAQGNPQVAVRYDPAHPDTCMVLGKDNQETLPFQVWGSEQTRSN